MVAAVLAEDVAVDFGYGTNEAIFAGVPFLFMGLAGFLVGFAEFCGFFEFFLFAEFSFGLDWPVVLCGWC